MKRQYQLALLMPMHWDFRNMIIEVDAKSNRRTVDFVEVIKVWNGKVLTHLWHPLAICCHHSEIQARGESA
jgi:hypothetical protein